jgi:RNA polymerase I-specific transcription initiation factor RRN6
LLDLDANVLQPLEPCIAPSIQAIPERKQKPSSIARSYRQWSVKTLPEIFPANLITTPLAQAPSAIDIELSSNVGSLLGIGQAADSERVSGSRKPEIFAMPCGEAGHILRLTRPRIESYGWGKQSAVRVALMNPASPDRGYWIGTGGAIRQISFADDDNGSGTWLAVRQATATTIFRPIYREISSASEPLNSYRTAFPSSNLNPNPVAVLTAEQSGSKCHMDVSVNPWYARQFAVIDQLGRWSIWDVEGRGHRSSSLKLVPGRSGQIYDGIVPDAGLKMAEPDLVDGWHRVLWASGVTTIVVCNRRHVAVFDVKATPIRLDCPDFLPANNSDSILDVKRSAMNLSHLFILTTSRIFWIEVTPAGEERDSQNGYIGAKVILSYRHFRDSNDETMKLTVVKDEKGRDVVINYHDFANPLQCPFSSHLAKRSS